LGFECSGGFALYDWSYEAFGFADAFEEEFGDVFDGDVVGRGFAGGAAEHAFAERAAYGEDFFSACGRESLLDLAETIVGDALVARLFFLPELSSAGATAERVFAVAGEFDGGVTEDVEEIAGGIVDAIMAA